MTAINLTVTRSPLEVGAMLDRLRLAPLGDVLGALGLPAVQLSHMPGRMVAYAGDGPNSAEIEYERVPLVSPFDVSRTAVTITAHDREGGVVAAMLTAALSA